MMQPKLNILSQKQIENIFQGALETLQHTGIKIKHAGALEKFKSMGITVSEDTAYIAPQFVKQALQSAPEMVFIYNREGELAMRLGKDNSYYGTGSDCPYILDNITGERRQFTLQDIKNTAILCDALPHINFMMSLGLVSGKETKLGDLIQFEIMMNHTIKPIVFTSLDVKGTETIFQMAASICGSEKQLIQKPFLIHYIEPISPLTISSDAIDKLILSAKKNLPVVFTPGPMAGATSPVTLAGTLTTALSEILSGLVLSQFIQKGHNVIIGGTSGIMDMKTSITPYGGPEFLLLNAAMSEICHFLDLPMFGTAGCSDSKCFDGQASLEAYSSILMQTLCRSNLIHDIGYLESGLTGSLEMLVLSNELIGMTKQFMGGISTETEDLALHTIHQVGPGGHFLTAEHTLKHYRDYWDPQLMDRQIFQKWSEKGKMDLKARVNKQLNSLLASHQTKPLKPEVQQKISQFIEKRKKEFSEKKDDK